MSISLATRGYYGPSGTFSVAMVSIGIFTTEWTSVVVEEIPLPLCVPLPVVTSSEEIVPRITGSTACT